MSNNVRIANIISYLLIIILLTGLVSCQGDKKADKTDSVKSINKIWVFKKIDTAKSNLKNASSLWIGGNTIDMSSKDTLRYSTIATNNGTTNFAYKVSSDYIYLNGKKAYKVLALTDSTLELSAFYRVKGQNGLQQDSVTVVMEYKAR